MKLADIAFVENRYHEYELNKRIHEDDLMYQSGESWYFSVGYSGLLCVLHGLAQCRLSAVASILDLPCGHGRVARHLRAAFPEAEMAFCDLSRSGVDFCAEAFGGTRIYSQTDLANVEFPSSYDVIWIGSLFTHVDRRRTAAWLQHLVNFLNQDGILLATFHGRWSIEVHDIHPLISPEKWEIILKGHEKAGYGYADYGAPYPDNYGISLCKASTLVEIASRIEGIRLLGYTERGWADNHDVMVLGRTDRLERWKS